MNDCLVTKLKSVVEDNNLLKIGEIRFVCVKPDGGHPSLHTAYISANAQIIASITGGEWLNGGGSADRIIPATGNPVDICPDRVGAVVSIDNKYAITKIQTYYAFDSDLEDFSYCTSLEYINSRNHGDVKALANLPLISIALSGTEKGSINNLPKTIKTLYVARRPDITGNINAMTGFTALEALDVSNCPNITGSAATFLAAHPGCTLTYAGSGVTA